MNESRKAIQSHIDARSAELKTVTALHKSYSRGGKSYEKMTESFAENISDLTAVIDGLKEDLADFPEDAETIGAQTEGTVVKENKLE